MTALGQNIPRQRAIEWWALLNCHTRPEDLASPLSDAEAFDELNRLLPKRERMDFWNGPFECGKNKGNYL